MNLLLPYRIITPRRGEIIYRLQLRATAPIQYFHREMLPNASGIYRQTNYYEYLTEQGIVSRTTARRMFGLDPEKIVADSLIDYGPFESPRLKEKLSPTHSLADKMKRRGDSFAPDIRYNPPEIFVGLDVANGEDMTVLYDSELKKIELVHRYPES